MTGVGCGGSGLDLFYWINKIMKIQCNKMMIVFSLLLIAGCKPSGMTQKIIMKHYTPEVIKSMVNFDEIQKGKMLLKFTSTHYNSNYDQIMLVDFSAREVQEIPLELTHRDDPWLSTDGNYIIYRNKYWLYTYDIRTKKSRRILNCKDFSIKYAIGLPNVMLLAIYYYEDKLSQIIKVNNRLKITIIQNKREDILQKNNDFFNKKTGERIERYKKIELTNDGNYIYALPYHRYFEKLDFLGQRIKKYEFGRICLLDITLSPDGKYIYFVKRSRESPPGMNCIGKFNLCRVRTETDEYKEQILEKSFDGIDIFAADSDTILYLTAYNFKKGIYSSDVACYKIKEKKYSRITHLLDHDIFLRPLNGFSWSRM